MTLHITTFYAFSPIRQEELVTHQVALRNLMEHAGITGTIYLATEGFNATLCGAAHALQRFTDTLKDRLSCTFRQTLHRTDRHAFRKAKVRVKPELIKMGERMSDHASSGTYVAPEDWNALISRDDVVVIDARNHYETGLGKFHGAITPDTTLFTELPEAVTPDSDAVIATYCTGGIRCEKYTAWLKDQGFRQVYHLQGGILRYLQEVDEQDSLWEGSCYVFDDRVAVGHDLLADKTLTHCGGCGHVLQAMDLRSAAYIPGQQCRFCTT